GCPWLDKDRISAGRELLESCAAEGRVRGLVFGHLHQVVTARRGAMAVLGTPSTCFQFEPASASFAVDRDADTGAPGYRWLELGTDGVLTSEVRRLGAFDPDNDASERS
ncbi:MAG: 3',5'-cyclic-AMP phosphodiesterase, partial [Pseudomonadota bacterium]